MAIFGKEQPPRSEHRATNGPVEAVLSIIATGMRITGDVETTGVLKVDGDIHGSITGARQVLLGRGGMIHGNVAAGEVVVGGTVEGSVSAVDRLELQATASVSGDIDTRSIVVIEGARINGVVRMTDVTAHRQEPLKIARG
jgi:cytoskeletal protein CcmA (bactofilin family)